MVINNVSSCPNCGGALKYYDNVPRLVRTKNRVSIYIRIRRLRCSACKTIHRELPDFIMPYKQYHAEVIRGVLQGYINGETKGYEDYPCEMTMFRWISQKIHLL